MLTIKSSQRDDYPKNLLSLSQLKRMGLMPAAGSKPYAIVNRQIYGNYYLYDKTKCVPYVSSEEEKEKRRISARKRKVLYTCPVCRKYLGACGFESTREPGMCDSCFNIKREEYRKKIEQMEDGNLQKSEKFYDFLVIDVEATGLSPVYDEILQLTILSPEGKVLFYETFCPYFNLVYPDASRVNGLSYEKVKDFSHIFDFVPLIREILAKTKVIMGYNVDFDMGFLKDIGIDFTDYSTIDVIRLFAEHYGEYNEEKGEYRYKSLSYAAGFFGYEFKAHDSKEDCLATLYVYQQLNV